jgi:hypothetical protein
MAAVGYNMQEAFNELALVLPCSWLASYTKFLLHA